MDLKRKSNIFLEESNKFDLCNGCCSNEDLKVLNIGHDNSSIRIVLCKECREKLIAVLGKDNGEGISNSHKKIKRYNLYFFKDKSRCIVYSTSYLSPLEESLLNIEKDIQKTIGNKNIKVYFDFLMCSGNGLNRFAEAYYDNVKEKIINIKAISVSKQNKLRKMSANYYKDKSDMIDNSILTSVQKKMIKKGIAI